MFKFSNAITVCVDVVHNIDVQNFVDEHVKTTKNSIGHVYLSGDKVYIAFETRTSVNKIAKLLEEKMYKSETRVIGNTIFVNFF